MSGSAQLTHSLAKLTEEQIQEYQRCEKRGYHVARRGETGWICERCGLEAGASWAKIQLDKETNAFVKGTRRPTSQS